MLTAGFLTVFAFLFSHFDIICWSYHAYIIFGFCSLLLGFILYISFLKSERSIVLPFVSLFLLLGILCYETFVFWPLAVIILSYMSNITNRYRFKKYKFVRSYLSVVGSVYFVYFAFFLLTRVFSIYEAPSHSLAPLLSISNMVFSSFAVFFNILYNNLLINFIPSLAFPTIIDANLNLGGFLARIPSSLLDNLIFLGGGLFIGAFLAIIIYLFRLKQFNTLKVIIFFLFLLFSEFFILFHCRLLTNSTIFNLTQFRYLYIPNALVSLIVLYLIDRFLEPSRREKAIICLALFLILMLNIQASRQGISILNAHLAPLKRMLSNIKTGINNRQINEENRLFINDDIAKRLPFLCWNIEMGELFMKGTYQWAFSEEEIKYFSSLEDAMRVINEEDFSIVDKSYKTVKFLEKPIQIDSSFIDAYTNTGYLYTYRDDLSKTYIHLGFLFCNRSDYDRALGYFREAIHLNPHNADAYIGLAHIYTSKGDYDKQIECLKKAIQHNLKTEQVFFSLGNAYHSAGNYDKAIESFEKAIQLNPNFVDIYVNLGVAYLNKGDTKNALKQVIKLRKLKRDNPANQLEQSINKSRKDHSY